MEKSCLPSTKTDHLASVEARESLAVTREEFQSPLFPNPIIKISQVVGDKPSSQKLNGTNPETTERMHVRQTITQAWTVLLVLAARPFSLVSLVY